MNGLRRCASLRVLLLVVVISSLFSMGAYAQEEKKEVIGVIDIVAVIREVESLRLAWEDFLAADEAYSVRASIMNQYHQQVAQEYGMEIGQLDVKDPEIAKKEKEIEDKYNKMLEDAQQELELERYDKEFGVRASIWQARYDEMMEIIGEVASENGVDVVLNKTIRPDAPIFQSVFYGGRDLTDVVIAALREKMKGIGR
jgi:Skp family chaperone for outer membrane proteins